MIAPPINARPLALSVSISGTQNDYHLRPGFDVFLITGSSSPVFTGFAGFDPGVSRIATLVNAGNNSFDINHQDTGSAATNRVVITGAANLTVAVGQAVLLIRDPVTGRWRTLH